MALSILYVVVWIGLTLWVSNDTDGNNWLIEMEADPFAAPLPNVVEDDWVAQLANPDFVSQSPNARVVIADQYFEKIRNLADEQGYDPNRLLKKSELAMFFHSISGLVEVRRAAPEGFGGMGKGSCGSGEAIRVRRLDSRSCGRRRAH